MKIREKLDYLDVDFESKRIEETQDFTAAKSVDEARKACGKDELNILNLGLQAAIKLQLAEKCKAKLPNIWYSETAYQTVFDSLRPKFEAKGIEGIKDLRKAFKEAAQTNRLVKEQIASTTVAEGIEI